MLGGGFFAFFWSRSGFKEPRLDAGAIGIAARSHLRHVAPQPDVSSSPARRGGLAQIAPRVEQIRDQVALDPHGTPSGLMEFADEVGREMEEGFQSPEKAKELARMLEGCALPELEMPISQSARALCAENLRRLAERFPAELRADWERVRSALPARVLEILEKP